MLFCLFTVYINLAEFVSVGISIEGKSLIVWLLKRQRKVNFRNLGALASFISELAKTHTERQIMDVTDSFDPNNETLVIQLPALKKGCQERLNKTNWRKLSLERRACYLYL